jgi:hypothetical protein
VQRRWRQPQAFGAARHGRVIDRLHVDAVAMQELVGGELAHAGVAHHDWDDVARRGHYRQASFGQPALQRRDALLVNSALDLSSLAGS